MLFTLPNEIINVITGFIPVEEMSNFILSSKKMYEEYGEIVKFASIYSNLHIKQSHISLYSCNDTSIEEYKWSDILSFRDRVLINSVLILKTNTPYKRMNFLDDTNVFVIDKNSTIKQLPSYSGVVMHRKNCSIASVRKTQQTFKTINKLYFSGFSEKMDKALSDFLTTFLIEVNYQKLNRLISALS